MKRALVEYSSSSDDDEEEELTREQKKSLVTLDKKEREAERVAERGRVFTSLGIHRDEPQQGDWLCHVYIRLDSESTIGRVLQRAQRFLLANKLDVVECQDTFHISLTRPILLRRHQCDVLVPCVRRAIEQYSEQKRPGKLCLAFTKIIALSSEDDRRTYFAAEVGQSWSALREMTNALDTMLQSRFRARAYYEEARFHASFAHLASSEQQSKGAVNTTVDALNERLGGDVRMADVTIVEQIEVSIGQKTYCIRL